MPETWDFLDIAGESTGGDGSTLDDSLLSVAASLPSPDSTASSSSPDTSVEVSLLSPDIASSSANASSENEGADLARPVPFIASSARFSSRLTSHGRPNQVPSSTFKKGTRMSSSGKASSRRVTFSPSGVAENPPSIPQGDIGRGLADDLARSLSGYMPNAAPTKSITETLQDLYILPDNRYDDSDYNDDDDLDLSTAGYKYWARVNNDSFSHNTTQDDSIASSTTGGGWMAVASTALDGMKETVAPSRRSNAWSSASKNKGGRIKKGKGGGRGKQKKSSSSSSATGSNSRSDADLVAEVVSRGSVRHTEDDDVSARIKGGDENRVTSDGRSVASGRSLKMLFKSRTHLLTKKSSPLVDKDDNESSAVSSKKPFNSKKRSNSNEGKVKTSSSKSKSFKKKTISRKGESSMQGKNSKERKLLSLGFGKLGSIKRNSDVTASSTDAVTSNTTASGGSSSDKNDDFLSVLLREAVKDITGTVENLPRIQLRDIKNTVESLSNIKVDSEGLTNALFGPPKSAGCDENDPLFWDTSSAVAEDEREDEPEEELPKRQQQQGQPEAVEDQLERGQSGTIDLPRPADTSIMPSDMEEEVTNKNPSGQDNNRKFKKLGGHVPRMIKSSRSTIGKGGDDEAGGQNDGITSGGGDGGGSSFVLRTRGATNQYDGAAMTPKIYNQIMSDDDDVVEADDSLRARVTATRTCKDIVPDTLLDMSLDTPIRFNYTNDPERPPEWEEDVPSYAELDLNESDGDILIPQITSSGGIEVIRHPLVGELEVLASGVALEDDIQTLTYMEPEEENASEVVDAQKGKRWRKKKAFRLAEVATAMTIAAVTIAAATVAVAVSKKGNREHQRKGQEVTQNQESDESQVDIFEVAIVESRTQLIEQVSELIDEISGDELSKAASRLRAEMMITKSEGKEKELIASLEKKKVKAKRERREDNARKTALIDLTASNDATEATASAESLSSKSIRGAKFSSDLSPVKEEIGEEAELGAVMMRHAEASERTADMAPLSSLHDRDRTNVSAEGEKVFPKKVAIKANRNRREDKSRKAATIGGEARKALLLDLTTCTDATEDTSSPEPSPSKSVHIENFLDLSVDEEEIGEEVELGTALMLRAADELAAPHSSSQDTPTKRTADSAPQCTLQDEAVGIIGPIYTTEVAQRDHKVEKEKNDMSYSSDDSEENEALDNSSDDSEENEALDKSNVTEPSFEATVRWLLNPGCEVETSFESAATYQVNGPKSLSRDQTDLSDLSAFGEEAGLDSFGVVALARDGESNAMNEIVNTFDSQHKADVRSISRDRTSLSGFGEEVDVTAFFGAVKDDGAAVDAEECNHNNTVDKTTVEEDVPACCSYKGIKLLNEFNDTNNGDIAILSPSLGDELSLKELSFHLEVRVLLNAIYGKAPTDEYAERRVKALFERYQGQEDILIAALRLQAEDKAAVEQAIAASNGDNAKGSSKKGTLSEFNGVASPTKSSKQDKITVITPDTKVSEEVERTPSNSAPIEHNTSTFDTSTVDPVLVSDDFNDEIATIGAELDDLFNV